MEICPVIGLLWFNNLGFLVLCQQYHPDSHASFDHSIYAGKSSPRFDCLFVMYIPASYLQCFMLVKISQANYQMPSLAQVHVQRPCSHRPPLQKWNLIGVEVEKGFIPVNWFQYALVTTKPVVAELSGVTPGVGARGWGNPWTNKDSLPRNSKENLI